MACVLPINGVEPQRPAFLAPNATLIGDVRFGADCSVWFGAVIRADINHIAIGTGSNVQDLCCLHVSKAQPCVIGNHTSLGHQAIAHACQIGDGCLLGMGCRVLDGAAIGDGCLIAAGCVVPEGLTVPPGHLVAGVPGKVRPLRAELRERIASIAGDYIAYQAMYPSLLQAAEDQCR